MTLHQQDSRMSVRETQSGDLTTEGKCECRRFHLQMQECDNCVVRDVGVVTSRSDVRLQCIIGVT